MASQAGAHSPRSVRRRVMGHQQWPTMTTRVILCVSFAPKLEADACGIVWPRLGLVGTRLEMSLSGLGVCNAWENQQFFG